MAEQEAAAGGGSKDAVHLQVPRSDVAYAIDELSHVASTGNSQREAELRASILEWVQADSMLPLYKVMCATYEWPEDEALVAKMSAANDESLAALNLAVEAAIEDGGDIEIKNAYLKRAHFLCRIGDWDAAVEAYKETMEKNNVGSGAKVDIMLTLLRIGLLYNRPDLTVEYMEPAKTEVAKSGDWERRNRFRLYEALHLVKRRRWPQAAEQLLDCAPVFTATEIISFNSFVFLAAILGVLVLDRASVLERVIKSTEANQVFGEDAELARFVESLHQCQYRVFMEALVPVLRRIKADFWLRPHCAFYARSIRVKAYAQFIEPFSYVRLSSMAESFGLPADFLEEDVADFVANAKLNCRVNKVTGVIVCTRRSETIGQRTKTLQKGDLLLNQLQKSLTLLKS